MLPVIIAVFPGCGCRTVKLDHLSYEREKKIDNRARNGSPSIETIRRGDISKVKKFHDNVYIYICVYISNARHSFRVSSDSNCVIGYRSNISAFHPESLVPSRVLKKIGVLYYIRATELNAEEANATLRRVSEFRMGL